MENGIDIEITDEECEYLDSIYLPSKYSMGSELPDYEPDFEICNNGIAVAKRVCGTIKNM